MFPVLAVKPPASDVDQQTATKIKEKTIYFWIKDRRQSQDETIFTIQRVNFEACHLLGQDGLGQVEESWVIDGEVAVITVQNPDSCPLDAKTQSICRQCHSKYRSNNSC